jgi:ectoine hydroxylase-related dioxygenase (phytanoyl-CoA dioxygenase family)
VPFEAPAGSIVAMEGRVWHTSGANITADEDRPLLFGYYTRPFVRPQWNFSVGLRDEVQAGFSSTMRYRLGFDVGLNLGLPAPS